MHLKTLIGPMHGLPFRGLLLDVSLSCLMRLWLIFESFCVSLIGLRSKVWNNPVCVCEYILNLPMPGLNGCTDCNSRCKRFMKRLREILLDGHRNGSSLALSGSVVHENDFAVGKTIDYDLYRRPHETVLRHCAERLHILFLTNCEVATSKRFMCTSQC